VNEPRRNRPGLLLAVAGQWGSVGACVAMREAKAHPRCALVRRMGEGARAAGGRVWGPRPVALGRMRLAKRASMRKGCEGSGVEDNIRVVTERGLKAICFDENVAGNCLQPENLGTFQGTMPWQFVLRLLCRTVLWAARSLWEGARRTQSALHHHFLPNYTGAYALVSYANHHNLARYC